MCSHGKIGRVVKIGGASSSFDWTLPRFRFLDGENGDWYESPLFNACGRRWKFYIYPYGMLSNSDSDSVSVSLYRWNSGPPLPLQLTLGIRERDGGVGNPKKRSMEFSNDDCECFWDSFVQSSQLGWRELVLSLDVKRHVTADSSTQTQAEADVKEKQSSEKQGMEELQTSLRGLLAGGRDSDVTIKVRDKEFRAHTLILRARSTVFEAMFSHDMLERQSGRVTMEDCDPESFPEFLQHVYTGGVQMVTSGNVASLLSASDMYDLQSLKRACLEWLGDKLSVASFCDAITLAIRYDCGELLERATQFFCDHASHIVERADWKQFLAENPTVGNELYFKQLTR